MRMTVYGTSLLHLIATLFPGKDRDSNLSSSRELISSSAKAVDELITGLSNEGAVTLSLQLPCLQTVMAARDELHSALQSLSSWSQQVAVESRNSATSDKSTEDELLTKESVASHNAVRNRVVSKIVYSFPSGVSSSSSLHWV